MGMMGALIIIGYFLSGLLALFIVGRCERDFGHSRDGGGTLFFFGYIGLLTSVIGYVVLSCDRKNKGFIDFFINLGSK